MRAALKEGRKALPDCLPNPPVGCVLVKGDQIFEVTHSTTWRRGREMLDRDLKEPILDGPNRGAPRLSYHPPTARFAIGSYRARNARRTGPSPHFLRRETRSIERRRGTLRGVSIGAIAILRAAPAGNSSPHREDCVLECLRPNDAMPPRYQKEVSDFGCARSIQP